MSAAPLPSLHPSPRMLRPLLLVLALLLGGGAFAQGVPAASGVAVYRYAQPGQPTKDIQVWGAVRSPGVYQVERDADLLTLLTIAGGPAVPSTDDRAVRNVSVRVVRDPGGARTVVLDTTLDALTSDAAPLPALQHGDLVSLAVETRQRFTWRDALSITTSVAALAVLILRIVE